MAGWFWHSYFKSYAIVVLPAASCDKQKREDGKDWGGELIIKDTKSFGAFVFSCLRFEWVASCRQLSGVISFI